MKNSTSIIMNEQIEKVMKGIQSMPENDMTKNVIIPLLKYLGYKKVEFYGGTNEEGKDIVFWEVSKLGVEKLHVAQVKHFKLSNKASGNDSFQTVVNQLAMCFEKKILCTNKQSHHPKEALLISTYPIDTKTLESRFSDNPVLPVRSIEIIDGFKLASLLIEHEQPIVKNFLGDEVSFTSYFSHAINNKILLKALGFSEDILLKNIYTDIDFSVGKDTSELFFNSKFIGSKASLNVSEKEWENLRLTLLSSEMEFGINYII